MEAGYRTPLLDFFRRGDVARDIRLVAAEGALAPRAHEQLALLMLLTTDADPDIAGRAAATLARIPQASIAAFLARSDAGDELRAFFAARGILAAAVASAGDEPLGAEPEAASDGGEEDETGERLPTVQRLAQLSVVQRLTLAMKGTREERSILIRDPNKIVSVSVLSSPKLTENEVEVFARMANVSEEVLRTIGHTRAWMKHYGIVAALARNPKTPLALSLTLLARLTERDLRALSIDHNVAEPLRVAARKKLVIGTDGRR